MPHGQLPRTATRHAIRLALREDAASRDRTSRAVIPPAMRIRARHVAQPAGILAGGPVAAELSGQAGSGTVVCIISGGNSDAAILVKILTGQMP